ncbi:MAG: DnaD domain protein [Clostridiaceae bacterium]|nr:DnaD domain protein [Clostridiaceae bacterium]
MSFCKFSNDYLMESFTLVDNVFINEYMPYAEEKQIKAYLYGLYLCSSGGNVSGESFAKTLDIEIDELTNIFTFWEDAGLVRIISKQPFEVSYLSLKRSMQPPKKFKSEKYSDFNKELQRLFPERMLTPNEFNEYYLAMELCKIQQEAMLMIVQYCINLKGVAVRYPYILTVAKAWAAEGVLTADDVERKLTEYETQTETMRAVLRALGKKGDADLEEKQYLLKWTKNWGFETNSLVCAAKRCKGKGFKKLDVVLDEYYRMGVFTAEEMNEFQSRLEGMKNLAVKINRTIGVYYESLEHVVEVYVAPWLQKGYDEEALVTLAHYCFLKGIKTLEGINGVVDKFFKLGLLTKDSINQFIERQLANDSAVKRMLDAASLTRNVTASDRTQYRIWTVDWGFSEEIIEYAATLSVSRPYPLSHINRLLADWRSRGVKSVEDAKRQPQYAQSGGTVAAAGSRGFKEREYTQEDLAVAFADLRDYDDLEDI